MAMPNLEVFVVCFLLGILTAGTTCAGVVGERCDWTGSGESTGGRGVTPIYLRCASGSVRWLSPRGALRVVLRQGVSAGAAKDFRGCIRLKNRVSDKLARVFLEVPGSLSLLHTSAVRCFESRDAHAALFIEATNLGPMDGVFALEYDLEPLATGRRYRPSDECKPCSHQQMVDAYCTSDLVVRGHIAWVEEDRDDPDSSVVRVGVSKWLRRVGGTDNRLPDASEPPPTVNMALPRHCGARHGEGEFVLMARKRLGRLALGCAPRLDDWVAATVTENQTATARCLLHT